MGKLSKTFRTRLLAELEPHGAIAAAAQRSEISRKTIDHWLAGRRVPDLDQVEAVANAIGRLSLELLMSDAEKKELSFAWREVIRRVGEIDESQVSAATAGILAALSALKLNESERLGEGYGKLSRPPKRKA